MPLHIFLSTWIGTSFHMLEIAKVLKDVVLVGGFSLALIASVRQPWFKPLLKDKLVWIIAAYAALTIILGLIKSTDQDAEVLGVVYNLRFLLFFIYAMLLGRLFEASQAARMALRIVMIVALPVLAFGILQYTLLPDTALSHVGYSRANGVLPVFYIDDKPDLERSMSTLRDPNSFGSYIIIILAISLTYFLVSKNQDFKKAMAGFVALSILALWFTFSRSAWIGAIAAMASVFLLRLQSAGKLHIPKKYLLVTAAIVVIGVAVLFPLRNSYFVQNVILHADESTVLEDPNELRVRFWKESIEAVVQNPLGHGPGTAGLASIRNNMQGTILNENYYFQLLHEVGVLGFAMFLAIIILVAKRLYERVKSPLALALLASLAGLLITNFLAHIWSNEAVAYTWWGLAGLVLALDSRDTRRARVRKN